MLSSDPPELAALKAAIRREAAARRRALKPERDARSLRAADAALAALPQLADPGIVGGYIALNIELDPEPLLAALLARGATVAMPITGEDRAPLVFRQWWPGQVMQPGRYEILEPPPDASILYPQTVLVPLTAFDERGGRLGYGGGHYDNTLAQLQARGPCLALGFAYAAQQVAHVPMGDFDRRLDYVLTEDGVLGPFG